MNPQNLIRQLANELTELSGVRFPTPMFLTRKQMFSQMGIMDDGLNSLAPGFTSTSISNDGDSHTLVINGITFPENTDESKVTAAHEMTHVAWQVYYPEWHFGCRYVAPRELSIEMNFIEETACEFVASFIDTEDRWKASHKRLEDEMRNAGVWKDVLNNNQLAEECKNYGVKLSDALNPISFMKAVYNTGKFDEGFLKVTNDIESFLSGVKRQYKLNARMVDYSI